MRRNTEITRVLLTNPENSAFDSGIRVLANQPLENTTLVLSVPAMGEWHNGNLLRLLQSLFSQNTRKGESFEIQIIINIGDQRKHLLPEANESLQFLANLVEIQKLLRASQEDNEKDTIQSILLNCTDPIQRRILELAIRQVHQINLTVVDLTGADLSRTAYKKISISSLRTLGVDLAKSRFSNNPNTVLGLYDADTIPENNKVVSDIQNYFRSSPELSYLFLGMTYQPAGVSLDYLSGGPGYNIERTAKNPNGRFMQGSPQILFRLNTYNKIQEISFNEWFGEEGDEDDNTSFQLVYYFSLLQAQQFHSFLKNGNFNLPTSMTKDRDDGSFDSRLRVENIDSDITPYIRSVFATREEVTDRVKSLSAEEQLQITLYLDRVRKVFEKKQRIQQRMNRRVVKSLLKAVEMNIIELIDKELQVQEPALLELDCGFALAHFIRSNTRLIVEFLLSPQDIQVAEYLVGIRSSLPNEITELSPAQIALREYVGELYSLSDLESDGLLSVKKAVRPFNEQQSRDFWYYGENWLVEEKRADNSKISFLHGCIAESLALGFIYKILFERNGFMEYLDSLDPNIREKFPLNPEHQERNLRFGNIQERIAFLDNILAELYEQ